MKLIIGSKEGKTYTLELSEEQSTLLNGKKVGDVIPADIFGLAGYELKLTGGSDNSGFPMRKTISGNRKVHALLSSPPGFRPRRNGEKRRKTVRGNVYDSTITEVNCVVVKNGAQPLDALLGKKEENKEEKK